MDYVSRSPSKIYNKSMKVLGGVDCKVYGGMHESIFHVLRDCPKAIETWVHTVHVSIKNTLGARGMN